MIILQKTGWLLLHVCLFSAAIACRNPAQKQDSKDVADDKNGMKFDNKDQEKTASFVVDAVAGFYELSQLAELAAQKTDHPGVKEIAAGLKEDYTPLLERFKAFAATNNISLPSGETKDAREANSKLAALPLQQFDKQWCELLMDKHKKAIASYETTASDAISEPLKNLVMDALPALRRQYDKLMQYHHKL